jgi:superfamily II DNA/RNA helicase
MPTNKRRQILDVLKNLNYGETGLVSNARCLTEGIDVPTLDAVVFVDPKTSQVDIIQAIGRAIRLGGANKTHGTVVVPVHVPTEKSSKDSTFLSPLVHDEIVKKFALWADTINCEITHQNNSGREDCYHYGIRRKNSGHLLSIGDEGNSTDTCIACKNSKKSHPSCNWKFEKCAETINYGVTSNGINRTDLNPFKELLKKHSLYKNKHIPIDYIINDRETRLQVLAGFTDTDGTIKMKDSTPSVEISQSDRLHGNLIDQLDFIAKSLGFSTSINYNSMNKKTSKGFDKTMKILRIFGENIYEIPTLIERKKIIKLNERKKHTMNYSRFTLK